MYSTTAIVKNSKMTGRIVGTHQQLDQAARRLLGKVLPHDEAFPTSRQIIHFEGTRGPDGLKRKSPGVDEPSHMLHSGIDEEGPGGAKGHENLDLRSVDTLIRDHRWNLVRALRDGDQVRAAFEAAWMAHMVTDGLTPAHHFPLAKVKNNLMTDKEMVRIFGQPIKGLVHGRNLLETMRNNWLYWGASGDMLQHLGYEYGVLMLAATLPQRAIMPKWDRSDFERLSSGAAYLKVFDASREKVMSWDMYGRFRRDGWTTDLARETKNLLLPEIVKLIALGWYSAAKEAYKK